MRSTVILLSCFLMGFSSDHELKQLNHANRDWTVEKHLPDLTDMYELLPKEGDLVCPDTYTEHGKKMVFVGGSIALSIPDAVKDQEKYAKYIEKNSHPDVTRIYDVYSHGKLTIYARESSLDSFFGDEIPFTEDLELTVKCRYNNENNKEKFVKFTSHKSVTRCFELNHGGNYSYKNNRDRILSSALFWCR